MAEENKSSLRGWGRWFPGRKTIGIALGAVVVVAALLWWRQTKATGKRPRYGVYAVTNSADEDRDATATEIQNYLNEYFSAEEYEYIGIIGQRMPSAQSPSTTTYVLFKRR